MNKIKILPLHEVQKIAAGEVVERPANIVKEAVENSIDSGANQISLYIEQAGKKLIRIVDNGCGMDLQDAKLCFHPHATSKIEKVEDLEKVSSFGFRGEALASISSISKTKLKTKIEKNELGIKLELDGGKIISEEQIACAIGTDLQVKDLFFNTPVRKKFLKREETEWNQIQTTFYSFCLSRVDVHFKLYREGKLILNAPVVDDVKTRASQIWGHNFAQNLISIQENQSPIAQKNHIKIYGFISDHNFSRYGRQQIFFFANKRWIKNQGLGKALLKGYLNVLPPAKFPAAFIFIDLNQEFIDINIHPRKEEVRFTKPKTVENSLQKIVQQTLANNLSKKLQGLQGPIRQDASPVDSDFAQNFSADFEKTIPHFLDKETVENKNQNILLSDLLNKRRTSVMHNLPARQEVEQNVEKIKETQTVDQKIIGQLFNTYILIDNKDEFIIIDQHAAHERVLYEKYLIKFEKKEGTRLLFPEIIQLKTQSLNLILEHREFLSNQGIEVEQFGQDQLAIKTCPPKLQNQSLKDFIFQMAQFIEENDGLDSEEFRKKLNEHVHSHLACKMAVKAGDKLTIDQMQKLIKDLNSTEKRFICVHGRPTTWSISKIDLEKKFRRR